ncbi:MAG TPA: DUF4352 domain-containing protein, partial [Anaerolineae bacterium]|nr:DUF4352 domain-containing protein [Anaerolineae bacterium]
PDDVEPLEPGDTYRVGESLEAPERGVSFQIQSAWLRQESLGNMWKLGRDEQFVVVHVIAPTSGDVKPLDQTRELALVDDSGYSYELQEYASDYLTLRLGPHNQRGVLVFKGPRDATGLMLEFNPLDPATMGSDSPEPLEDEAVTIELGELEAAPAVVLQGAEPKPTAKAEPGDEPSGGVHRLGEEVVSGSLAITVNGYESHGGPAGYESGAGRSWMVAYVTVENVGRADVQLYAEQFDFVDAEGGVYNELWNAASVWDDAAPHVLEYHKLAPGDRLEDKVVIIQIEDELIPELKLRYRADDDSYVMWRLSF